MGGQANSDHVVDSVCLFVCLSVCLSLLQFLKATIHHLFPNGEVLVELFDSEGSINTRILNESRTPLNKSKLSVSQASLSAVSSSDFNASDKGGKPPSIFPGKKGGSRS